MKLDRFLSGAFAAAAVALACGCGSSPTSAPKTAQNGFQASVDTNVSGTTSLMSAEYPGPAPKVGKAHLANDNDNDDASDAVAAPKDARRSDGSRRGGGFGASK